MSAIIQMFFAKTQSLSQRTIMETLIWSACYLLCLILVHSDQNEIRQKRIVNGIPISATKYPFIASLIQYDAKSGSYSYSFCGGSLLRKSYPAVIITAAHCLANLKTGIQVDLHRSDIDAEYSLINNYARYNALGYIIHKDYNDVNVDNDIALVFLDVDLTAHSHLITVSIPNLRYYNLYSKC